MCTLFIPEHIRYTQGIHKVYTRYTQGDNSTPLDSLPIEAAPGISILLAKNKIPVGSI